MYLRILPREIFLNVILFYISKYAYYSVCHYWHHMFVYVCLFTVNITNNYKRQQFVCSSLNLSATQSDRTQAKVSQDLSTSHIAKPQPVRSIPCSIYVLLTGPRLKRLVLEYLQPAHELDLLSHWSSIRTLCPKLFIIILLTIKLYALFQ